MKARLLMASLGILLALDVWTGWELLGEPYVGMYNASNAGIFISTQNSCTTIVGYEWRGTPGFFSGGVC